MGGIQQRVLGNFWDIYCTTTSYAILLSYDLKIWVFNFQLFDRGLFSGTISQGGEGPFFRWAFSGERFSCLFSDGIFPGTVIFNLGNIQVIGNINGRIDKCWNNILKFADKIFLSSTNLIEFLFEDLSLKKRLKIFQNILFSVIEIVLSF